MSAIGAASVIHTPQRQVWPQGTRVVAIYQLVPSPAPVKARKNVDILDLQQQIESTGILKPLTVCQRGSNNEGKPVYQILKGHRRWMAAKNLQLRQLPISVINALPRLESLSYQLSTNKHRKQLNLLDEAEAIMDLLMGRLELPFAEVRTLLRRMAHPHTEEDGGINVNPQHQESVKQILKEAGRSLHDYRGNMLKFLSYKEDVKDAYRRGDISRAHACLLGNFDDDDLRGDYLQQSIEGQLTPFQLRGALNQHPAQLVGDDTQALTVLRQAVELKFQQLRDSPLWNTYDELADFHSQLDEYIKYATTQVATQA